MSNDQYLFSLFGSNFSLFYFRKQKVKVSFLLQKI